MILFEPLVASHAQGRLRESYAIRMEAYEATFPTCSTCDSGYTHRDGFKCIASRIRIRWLIFATDTVLRKKNIAITFHLHNWKCLRFAQYFYRSVLHKQNFILHFCFLWLLFYHKCTLKRSVSEKFPDSELNNLLRWNERKNGTFTVDPASVRCFLKVISSPKNRETIIKLRVWELSTCTISLFMESCVRVPLYDFRALKNLHSIYTNRSIRVKFPIDLVWYNEFDRIMADESAQCLFLKTPNGWAWCVSAPIAPLNHKWNAVALTRMLWYRIIKRFSVKSRFERTPRAMAGTYCRELQITRP